MINRDVLNKMIQIDLTLQAAMLVNHIQSKLSGKDKETLYNLLDEFVTLEQCSKMKDVTAEAEALNSKVRTQFRGEIANVFERVIGGRV